MRAPESGDTWAADLGVTNAIGPSAAVYLNAGECRELARRLLARAPKDPLVSSMPMRIGGDLIEHVRRLIVEKVKYDDAAIVARVGEGHRVFEWVSYDERLNLLIVHVGETSVPYVGLREGWRP